MRAPTVFISYSHDSPEHAKKVLAFSDQLVADGIDCILDQYDPTPGEGWPRWMDKHIRDADFVIMICTQTYYRRVMGDEKPGEGLGVRWEGSLIYQHLYIDGTINTRFIPVLFKDGKSEHIPTPLAGATHHRVDTKQGYENLYRQLTNQPAAVKPKLGKLRKLAQRQRKQDFFAPQIAMAKMPSTNPELFGREKELETLDKAWENPQTNIISLVAFGGVGKTALVNKWLKQVGNDNWRRAERVLGWSFYSQGAAEGKQVSADQFIAHALDWFGDEDPTKGSPWDKGERLAELVKKQRTLLILDGLEPLQNPPGPEEGRIKDPGLQCLLRELAIQNQGLCVITTRLKVDDIKDFVGNSVVEHDLDQLSPEAGAQFLRNLAVKNATDDELKEAVAEYDGHALALELLGKLLSIAFDGDIRRRNRIPALMVEKERGGHARRVMEWYEKSFVRKPEMDILRVMGLFDRPVEDGAIEALKAKPSIEGLTTKIQKVTGVDWKYALKNLREAGLLSPEDANDPDTLDCHPLVREHFGEKLEKNNPGAWKEAHSRLYEYYKSVPEKDLPDTIEEMAPLYAAVTHGCQANRHQEALDEVYWRRISRGREKFAVIKLGAFGADLAALSGFLGGTWLHPVGKLRDADKSFVISCAGFRLRALGRLAEAARPMERSLKMSVKQEDWMNAAISANNLSELFLTMGDLDQALRYAQQSVKYADRSGEEFHRMNTRTTVAEALHQLGRLAEAESEFSAAEEIQKVGQPKFPFLYSLPGFRYCDLLFSQGSCERVLKRATQTVEIAQRNSWLLDIALDHLSIGHAYMVKAQTEQGNNLSRASTHLNRALDGLRQAGMQDYMPRGLLARAELFRVQGNFDKAQGDATEGMTIATRSGMRLYEADCFLEYARLYLAMEKKDKARENLEIAAKMIEKMGYHRRDPEVQLVYAQLYLAEGNKDKAREHLNKAKKMIDDMGMHRWDKDAEDLSKQLA